MSNNRLGTFFNEIYSNDSFGMTTVRRCARRHWSQSHWYKYLDAARRRNRIRTSTPISWQWGASRDVISGHFLFDFFQFLSLVFFWDTLKKYIFVI